MSTLTVYGDTADWWVKAVDPTYATARGGTTMYDGDAARLVFGQYLSGSYVVAQAGVAFDTSALTAAAVPSAVALSLYGSLGITVNFVIEARLYDWGAAFTTADFVAGANLTNYTLAATYNTASPAWSAAGYNTFTENGTSFQTGLNQTGTTRLLLNSQDQRTNTAPTSFAYTQCADADTAGTTNDPKLVITYTLPTATATSTIAKLTSAGNVAQKQAAAATSTIAKLTSAAVAKQAQKATAASTIAKLTSLGAVMTPPPGWAGDSTLPKLTSAATTFQLQTAAAASSLPKLTSAATVAQIFKGVGGSTLPALISLGGVVMVQRGAGASALPMLTAAGVGNIPMSGSGASTLPMLTSLGGVLIVTIGALPHIRIGGGYPVNQVRIHGGANTSGVRLSGGFFV